LPRPPHVTRPSITFTTTKPRLVKLYFEPVSSDIKTQLPYIGPRGLHVYIPTCSIKFVLARLKSALSLMKNHVVYEVRVVLGFVGQECHCGTNHWQDMGWMLKDGALTWPAGDLGVDKYEVNGGLLQLKRRRY
jgi:hypothetical protein